MNPKFKSVFLWKETHEKLVRLAESQSRSQAGQVDYLVNEEVKRLATRKQFQTALAQADKKEEPKPEPSYGP